MLLTLLTQPVPQICRQRIPPKSSADLSFPKPSLLCQGRTYWREAGAKWSRSNCSREHSGLQRLTSILTVANLPTQTSGNIHTRSGRLITDSALHKHCGSTHGSSRAAQAMQRSSTICAAASWDTAFRRVASIATEGITNAGKIVSPLPSTFPPGPQGNAAVGMLANPLQFLEATQASHGKIVGLKLGPEAVLLVSDQSTAREVLSTHAASYAKEGTAFFPGSRLAGNGLLVSDGSTWRRQRQLSNPAFRRAAVAVYSEAMEAAARSLVNSTWSDGASRDVYADYNALTLDIVTNVLFGWDLPADQASTIVGSIKVAFEFFANQAGIGIPEWIPTPGQQQYIQAVQRLNDVVYGIIEERTRELEESKRKPQCLLDNLLMARDESGQPMGRTALRDELMTLLVAGQETSAVLLAWTTAFLAFNPHVQAQAAAEIDQRLKGEAPSAQNTRDLPYLESVLLETLRLRPPAYLVGRCCAEAVQVLRYTIPEGTTFLISPYLMHRDKSVWGTSAATFHPDRWRTVRPDKPLGCLDLMQGLGHNGSYLPFGFAMSEALVVLCTALQRYTFSPRSTAFPRAAARITLRPESVRLTVRERHARLR